MTLRDINDSISLVDAFIVYEMFKIAFIVKDGKLKGLTK